MARMLGACPLEYRLHHHIDGRAQHQEGRVSRNGYRNIEWDVQFIGTRCGSIRFALLWIKRDEMLEDLQNFLSGFQVTVGDRKRAATPSSSCWPSLVRQGRITREYLRSVRPARGQRM